MTGYDTAAPYQGFQQGLREFTQNREERDNLTQAATGILKMYAQDPDFQSVLGDQMPKIHTMSTGALKGFIGTAGGLLAKKKNQEQEKLQAAQLAHSAQQQEWAKWEMGQARKAQGNLDAFQGAAGQIMAGPEAGAMMSRFAENPGVSPTGGDLSGFATRGMQPVTMPGDPGALANNGRLVDFAQPEAGPGVSERLLRAGIATGAVSPMAGLKEWGDREKDAMGKAGAPQRGKPEGWISPQGNHYVWHNGNLIPDRKNVPFEDMEDIEGFTKVPGPNGSTIYKPKAKSGIKFNAKPVMDMFGQPTGRYEMSVTADSQEDMDAWIAEQNGGGKEIPKAHADYLKANPSSASSFDRQYGAGAAKRVLGK